MQYAVKSALRIGIVLLVLFSAAVPIYSHAAGLGGTWEGQVTQDDPSVTYPIELNLYGNVGNVNYPSVPCGGNLEFIRTDGTSFWYRERITFGKDKCLDGIVKLSRHALGDNTAWEWRWEGGQASARGVLRGSGVAESK